MLFASNLLCGQSLEPDFGPPPIAPLSEELSAQESSSSWAPMPLSTGEDLLSGLESDGEAVPLYSARFAIDVTLADFELDDGTASYWTTEPTAVTRSEFALENQDGFGVRAQLWSLEKEFELDDGSLETRVSTFYLDGYRRFVGEHGELLIGGGLAVGSLKIDSPFVNTVHRFNGVGASLAGEGFYPLLRFEKTEFGVTGRARLALLGPLEDNFEDSQAVLVDELGVGLELRRRFGKHEDKLWFVRLGREYQHWTDAEVPLAVDQSVEGTSLTVGFAW